jgi:hypothetical protein
MSDIATRAAAVQSEHDRARAIAGVTGRTRVKVDKSSATRLKAEAVERAERERDARAMSERARHDEAARLARRMGAIAAARDAEQDDERRARLHLLWEDVQCARERYVSRTFGAPSIEEDWSPRGRFARYARRFDLGFIGYDADDVMVEAAEMLTAAGLMGQGVWPTIGDSYAAVKRVYRRGLGFYGYQRRGKVIERDLSERGYRVVESETVAYIREQAARDAEYVKTLMGACQTPGLCGEDCEACSAAWDAAANVRECEACQAAPEWAPGCDEHAGQVELFEHAETRRRALQTLANRFPLNADGRMLALATLLTEGYTVEEIAGHYGVQERTLFSWADQLATLGA